MSAVITFRSELHREIAQLRERNVALQREIEWLRELFMPQLTFPEEWRLTPAESALLSALYASKGFITREAALAAACGDETDNDMKIVDVHLCKMRKKLAPRMGKSVETIWGRGFRLSSNARVTIDAALQSSGATVTRRVAS